MLNRFITLLFCFVCFHSLIAAPVNFRAEVDATSIHVGRTIELRFILENAEGNSFVAPRIEGFKILNGPNRMFSSRIFNGQKSSSESYTFLLQAVKAGRHIIPSASIKTKGKSLTTNALEIEVIEQEATASTGVFPKNPEEVPVFLTTELSKDEAYEGEQIQLLYRIYARVGVEGIDILSEPSFDGFFVHNLERYDKRTSVQKIGKFEYQTRIIRAVSLFPMRTDEVLLEPLTVQAGIVQQTRSRDPFAGLLGRNINPSILNTLPKKIKVKKLPTPPENFSGAVGIYTFEANINKTNIAANESSTLTYKVSGNGDERRLQLPKPDLHTDFEAYEPKAALGETYETLDEIRHEQAWDIFILPKKEGDYTLKPTFCYFDTDSAAYRTLNSKKLTLAIGPATANPSNPGILDTAASAKSDFSAKLSRSLQSPFLWAILLLPLFVFTIFTLLKKQKRKAVKIENRSTEPISPIHPTINIQAKTAPIPELMTLNRENPKEFYAGLEKAIVQSVAQKTGLPANEIGRFDLVERVRKTHPNDSIADDLDALLETCERAVYGGLSSTESTDVHLARAASVLKRLS